MLETLEGVGLETLEGLQPSAEAFDFSRMDCVYDPQLGRAMSRWTLYLPGTGCAWAREKHGGCFFCGFKYAIDQLTGGKLFSKAEIEEIYTLGSLFITSESPEELRVYNGGNFFNPSEIVPEAQVAMARHAGEHRTVQRLVVESLPEYVTAERLQSLLSVLNGTRLRVSIGLECQSDEIRRISINKGFTCHEFEETVELLKAHDVELLTYVFLKPIRLTEREAVLEAIRTVEYAFAVGSDAVALEAGLVVEATIMADWYRKGKYRPPWLWSVVEVLRNTAHLGSVQVGYFTDEPPPIALPTNCLKCTPKVLERFDGYRLSGDLGVFEALECSCQQHWKVEVRKKQIFS